MCSCTHNLFVSHTTSFHDYNISVLYLQHQMKHDMFLAGHLITLEKEIVSFKDLSLHSCTVFPYGDLASVYTCSSFSFNSVTSGH